VGARIESRFKVLFCFIKSMIDKVNLSPLTMDNSHFKKIYKPKVARICMNLCSYKFVLCNIFFNDCPQHLF
jgi:hypothetical protein